MSRVLHPPVAAARLKPVPITLLTPDKLELKLLNSYQRNFPLTAHPYAVLAEQLGCDEASVLACLAKLQDSGAISRIGAVFRPNVIGVSALAALAVVPERLEQVADCVSHFAEINHNYQREHHFNLWFVATAPSVERLQQVFTEIETICESGPVLVLPMLEDFHIDLGFDLTAKPEQQQRQVKGLCYVGKNGEFDNSSLRILSTEQQALISVLQEGLTLVPRPYAALGCDEDHVLDTLTDWINDGVIKRFGVIVRHHELGFTANAMVVWDIPDAEVSEVGHRIAQSGRVTLCYRRPRRAPDWPYNLFCMVHGKDQDEVRAQIALLSEICALDAYPQNVLFSVRRFKQRGAYYAQRKKAL